jgi:outer membrane protein TolC
MRRRISTWRLFVVLALVIASGCSPTQPFYLHEDGDLSHYLTTATQTEHPDVHAPPLPEVSQSHAPLTLSNPEFREIWELTLEEAVSIALANTKILRGGQAARLQNGQIFAGTQEGTLVINPRAFASSYNPAIVESNPGFTNDGPTVDGGNANVREGVEAALSDFDAQLSVIGNSPNGAWLNRTDRPQNITENVIVGNFIPPTIDTYDGGLTTQIQKRSAEGTTFAFRNTTNYDRGNTRGTSQALISTWSTTLEAEMRQPLLRGRGAQINRMPIIIARIGTDIEMMGLQGQLQDTLNNIEIRYWDLYNSFRQLETAKIGRDSSLVTWRIVYDKWQNGVEPVQAEAQAREQYFAFRAQVETSLRELYNNENELRLLMGLSATDGRLIRPKDEPTLARVNFEWCDILAEAIARRPELISKRWEVKQREMELILARNQLLPQLDVGGVYRWVGLGDDLIAADPSNVDFPAVGSNAFEELFEGDFQEFSLFFSYQMPIGFRRELAGVRHQQLRLAREKALLEDMELDVSVGLAKAVRNLDANFQLAQTNANRWAASQKEVESVEALYRGGRASLDLVLEAQRRRAQGQAAFWTAVVEYNKSIADLHTRKGSILEYNAICFEEGPWPQKAYWDALDRARQRDAGLYMDYGWTRPAVISRGPTPQGPHGSELHDAVPGEVIVGDASAETIRTPMPTPAARPSLEPMDEGMDSPMIDPIPERSPRETRLPTIHSSSTQPVGSNPLRQGKSAVSLASYSEVVADVAGEMASDAEQPAPIAASPLRQAPQPAAPTTGLPR